MSPLDVPGLVIEIVFNTLVVIVWLIRYVVLKLLPKKAERDLRGQVVLVTGAGGYLGRALALQLAARGCTVACVDVREDDNNATVEGVRAAARSESAARGYVADLASREAIRELVRRVTADLGHVDILVNNAAVMQGGGVLDLSDKQVERMLDVNFVAAVWLVRELLPAMEDRGGHIVTIGSMSSSTGLDSAPMYSSSKGALQGFMHSARAEYERLGKPVHFTLVMPTFIRTDKTFTEGIDSRIRVHWLETDHVSKEIVRAIARRDYQVFVPECFSLLAALTALNSDRFTSLILQLWQVKVKQGVFREETLPAS